MHTRLTPAGRAVRRALLKAIGWMTVITFAVATVVAAIIAGAPAVKAWVRDLQRSAPPAAMSTSVGQTVQPAPIASVEPDVRETPARASTPRSPGAERRYTDERRWSPDRSREDRAFEEEIKRLERMNAENARKVLEGIPRFEAALRKQEEAKRRGHGSPFPQVPQPETKPPKKSRSPAPKKEAAKKQ